MTGALSHIISSYTAATGYWHIHCSKRNWQRDVPIKTEWVSNGVDLLSEP